MKILNFPDLLSRMLQGEIKASIEWDQYIYANAFQHEEITQTLVRIEEILSQEDHAQRSYALNLRAVIHESGLGGLINYPEAIRLYEDAIKLENADAMNRRARMHEVGCGGPVNYSEAIKLYEKAIKLGNTEAMNRRAIMHEVGRGCPVNYSEAIKLHEKVGNSTAIVNHAYMYENGRGRDYNYSEALRLYEIAIKLKNPEAMVWRAYMHSYGPGGSVNYSEQIRLYEDAIKLGHAFAMICRASMHENGRGGDINYPEAIRLYEIAIKLKNPEAMVSRAIMHEKGLGGDINYSEAIKLYKQAVELGNPDAMKVDLSSLENLAKLERIRITEQEQIRLKKELFEPFKKDPALNLLFGRIQIMGNYGFGIMCGGDNQEIDRTKGDAVCNLAYNLKTDLEDFLLNSANSSPTQKSIETFKENFTKKLHSIENEKMLDEHRAHWKPIVANILIALSVVGFVALFARVTQHAITSYRENKSMTFNQSLFFAKTKSRQLAEKIDESLNAVSLNSIKKDS